MKVIIDGIRYVPEVKEYEIGDIINYKGLDWYVIGTSKTRIELLTKDIIPEEILNAIKTEEDDIMFNKNYVRMSDTIRPIAWHESFIYNLVLPRLREYLNIEKGSLTILSYYEYKELPEEIKKCNDWYWLKTPYKDGEYNSQISSASFAGVYNDGLSAAWSASLSRGVRPCLKTNKSKITMPCAASEEL